MLLTRYGLLRDGWKICWKLVPIVDTWNFVSFKVKDMVRRIKEELGNRIMRAQWVSSAVKSSMLRKLDRIDVQIGYPEWYKDDQAVIRFYEGVSKR